MLFSIIVPVYNVERYLHRCINSVLTQTFEDYELILVDDGSRDDSGKIVDEFAAIDRRIVAIHKTNGGLVSARKAGLAVARGEYIIPLDADDWLAENALQYIGNAIDEHAPQMICYGHYVGTETELRSVPITHEKSFYLKDAISKEFLPNLLTGNRARCITPTVWGKAFKRDLYEKFQSPVDDRIQMGEDGMVVYPCFCEAESICFLPDILYCYRVNPDSLTRSKAKLIPWESVILRIEHLRRYLSLPEHDLQEQVGCYAAHAVFNAILTQMKKEKYRVVVTEAFSYLYSHGILDLICKANYVGSKKEKLAQFALRNRWFWLIKLYSVICKV